MDPAALAGSALERDLAGLLGPEQVLPGTTAAYLVDATESRGVRGHADAVALPRTAEEVAAVVAWCAERGVAVMAYSPLDEGRLVRHPALDAVAKRLGVSTAQVALAWLLRKGGVVTIPKAASTAHVAANRDAADLALDDAAMETLERAFPAPRRKRPLEMI